METKRKKSSRRARRRRKVSKTGEKLHRSIYNKLEWSCSVTCHFKVIISLIISIYNLMVLLPKRLSLFFIMIGLTEDKKNVLPSSSFKLLLYKHAIQ